MSLKFDIQFFGGGGGTSSQQYRKRDPEEPELTGLRKGLYGAVMPNIEAFDPSRWTKAQDAADKLFDQGAGLLTGAGGSLAKGDEAMNGLMELLKTGKVPQAMEDAATGSINRGLKSGMGEMLNSLGSRGVVNSSITGSGVSNLSSKAANAFQDAYLNNFNAMSSGYQGAMQGAQGNAAAQVGAGNALMGAGTQAFENAGAMLTPAWSLWKDAQTLYNGKEDFDTVVTQKGK
jgi:hypothetical protein